jgi:hypothetical protein
MIGIGQAEYLVEFAKKNGHYGVSKEFERIGIMNLINLLGQDQKRRLYGYMMYNKPDCALKLLSTLPSEAKDELPNKQ